MSFWTRGVRGGKHWGSKVSNAAKTARTQIERVTSHGLQHARNLGRATAKHVISVQRAAKLPGHLMEKSAKSVLHREPTRESDRSWTHGYADTVHAKLVELQYEAPEIAPEKDDGWWTIDPHKNDPELDELEIG